MHEIAPSFGRLMPLSKEEFQDLKSLDSCSIVDAIERFHIPLLHEGWTESDLSCRYPQLLPVLGYALTVKVRSNSQPGRGRSVFESDEWWRALKALPAPRILVLQDIDRHPGAGALIGEADACALKTLDFVTVVTNGAVRDLARIDGLDFQIFSGAVSLSSVHCHVVQVGGAVQVGHLEVSGGDLLHGDCNGLVRVPRDLAARIPATAVALRKKEEAIKSYCHADDFSVDGLRELLARD